MRIGFSILGHDMHVLDGRVKIILLAPRGGLPCTNVFRAECERSWPRWSFGRGKTFQGPRGQRHPVIYDTYSVHWRLWCCGRRAEAADAVELVAEANGDYYNADKVIRQRHSPELMISADFRFKFGDELRSLSVRR